MGAEKLKPDRRPPYTVRLMAGLADVFHIVARDGWSIIATCYERQEADGLARSANAFEPMREALLNVEWGGEVGAPYCPCCGRVPNEGHSGPCVMAAALRAADGEGQTP